MKREFIVLCGSVVGATAAGFDTVYGFDGQRFPDRAAAVAHGFTLGRSDDFNIGVIEDGRLVSLDWMDRPVDTVPDVLAPIAAQVGLQGPGGASCS